MSLMTCESDPLYLQPSAERPAYATGMLLDAADFSSEQTYHRGRLARAMAFLAGGGTLAGLAVSYLPEATGQPESIKVDPGLAVDRLGRLVEIPRPACLRLSRWFAKAAADGGDALKRAAYGNLARFVSPRMKESGSAIPARAVVADVFVRFALCPVGLTPSFAEGPFDALNAVTTARVRDAFELQLVLREKLGDSYSGLPQLPADAAIGDGSASLSKRRNAVQDAILAGYAASGHAGGAGGLGHLPEQPDDIDPTAIFLARLLLPVGQSDPPARTADVPVLDNGARRFLPPLPLLAQWNGL